MASDSGIPGHLPRQLLHYWAHGEGRARWIASPHPYTALVNALRSEKIAGHLVHGLAANIMKEATGIYPGQRPGVNHGR